MENSCAVFFSAINIGDVNKIVQLLINEETYRVVNAENEEGKTAFQVALENKNYGK